MRPGKHKSVAGAVRRMVRVMAGAQLSKRAMGKMDSTPGHYMHFGRGRVGRLFVDGKGQRGYVVERLSGDKRTWHKRIYGKNGELLGKERPNTKRSAK